MCGRLHVIIMIESRKSGIAIKHGSIKREDERPMNRPIWPAIKRGMRLKCPNCGEGKLFRSYLKVANSCESCGEPLHHHRADDAPAYFTMFIVGHIIVAGVMALENGSNPPPPYWVHALIWIPSLIILSLVSLPIIKGILVAYQWALRMHGFGDEIDEEDTASPLS